MKRISSTIDAFKKDARLKDAQICILTLKTEATSILAGVEKIGNHKIVHFRGEDGILFTTARKFKGLESDAVIIVDIDEDSFLTNRSKMRFYVGASRAKHFLELVYVGSKEGLTKIGERLDAERMPTPIATIKRCFEVEMK